MDYGLFDKFIKQVRQQAKVLKDNINDARNWYIISIDDLETSKFLYKKKKYALSTYHLQQFYEKITKAYFLLTGRVSPEEIHGHSYNVKQLKSDVKSEYIGTVLELSKQVSDKETSSKISNVKLKTEVLDIVEKNEEEIRNLTDKDFINILDVLRQIESNIINPQFLKKIEHKIKQKKLQKKFRHILFMITHFRISYGLVNDYTSQYNIKRYVQSALYSVNLLIIGLLTFVHCNTPRYPTSRGTNIGYFDYKKSLGIVKITPELFKHADQIIMFLKEEYFEKELTEK